MLTLDHQAQIFDHSIIATTDLSERQIRYILRCNARNVQDFKDRQEQERKTFKQLCVMQGVYLEDVSTKQFEAQFLERTGVRIKFETEVLCSGLVV